VNELFAAVSAAQGEIESVSKDAKAQGKHDRQPRYKYASLTAVIEACKEPLRKNGLCIIQTTDFGDRGEVIVTTILGHSSGQWISSRTKLPAISNKMTNHAQAVGSAISYARRYGYMAIIGLSADDDDAESISDRRDQREESGRRNRVPDYGERRTKSGRQNRRRPTPDARQAKLNKLNQAIATLQEQYPGVNESHVLNSDDVSANSDFAGQRIADCTEWQNAILDIEAETYNSLDPLSRLLVLLGRRCVMQREIRAPKPKKAAA
jgi:hypothetical protein